MIFFALVQLAEGLASCSQEFGPVLDAAAARHIDNPESGMRGHISWYEIDSQRCRVRQGTLGLI